MEPKRPNLSGQNPETAETQPLRLRSDELLQGRREVVIEHKGQQYRLLCTRNDRLILNK